MGFDLSSLTSLFKSGAPKVSGRSGVLGVDVGTSAIKIVQLKAEKGIPTLETYGELQLGPYEGVDIGRGTHLPPQKSIEALIDIIREAGATSKEVVFSLSYNASFTSTMLIPTLEQEQINPMLPIEARKYIPISLSKVSLDWIPLEVVEDKKSINVLVSAVYNEAAGRYDTIMKGAGLAIAANEIEIFSTIRSIVSAKDSLVGILDCGASSTRFYIVEQGVPKKTHSIPMSGVSLTNALSQALEVDFKDAEELKRSVGILGKAEDPRVQKALIGELERGFREIHTVMKRYEESESKKVAKIIVTGGGALIQGIIPYVSDMFSTPAVLAEPFSKVAYPAFLQDTLKEAGPSFAVAVGAALFTFRKEEK